MNRDFVIGICVGVVLTYLRDYVDYLQRRRKLADKRHHIDEELEKAEKRLKDIEGRNNQDKES